MRNRSAKTLMVASLLAVGAFAIGNVVVNPPAGIVNFIKVVTGATSGNIPAFNSAGQLYDSTVSVSNVATTSSLASHTGNTTTAHGALITSAAQGDILYRSGAGKWENLPAGDSGKYLQTKGAAANPAWETVSTSTTLAALTDANIASAEQGDILYYAGDGKWGNLHHGTSGQYLKTLGNAANPTWDTPAAPTTWSVINASTTALVNQGHFLYVAPGGAELDLTTPAAATIGQSIQVCILYNGAATSMWLYSDDPIEGSSDDLELDTVPPNAVWTFTYSNSEYGWVRTR